MSTTLRSKYLELWFGILLLGTLIFANGCSSNYVYTPPEQVYVTNGDSVSVFAVPSSGNANIAPGITLSGAATGLDGPNSLVFDYNNYTYITNFNGNSVTIYAPDPQAMPHLWPLSAARTPDSTGPAASRSIIPTISM